MNHYVLKQYEYPKRLSISDNSTNQNSEIIESHSIFSEGERESGKLFPCTFHGCEKQYSNKSRLLIHTRTHVFIY